MTNDAPLVGRDIPWSTVEGQLCKVIVFVPISTIESGKIKEPAMKLAYGGVTVEVMGFESRNIPKQIVLPVLHRLDFRNLWYLYEERGVGPQEEVLISYDPLKRKKIIGLFIGLCLPCRSRFIGAAQFSLYMIGRRGNGSIHTVSQSWN